MKIADNNLEYLLTRPGALKITTIVFGVIASILSSHSYGDSPYTQFFENYEDHSSQHIPDVTLEMSNMTITFIVLGISVVYLSAHCFFYNLSESRLNKFCDTAFHMCGGLFLFAGGAALMYSAVNIEKNGCPIFDKKSDLPNHPPLPIFSSIFSTTSWHRPTVNSDDEIICHFFGEKIVASCFNLLNAVIYAILGFVIFTTDVDQM